MKLLKEIKKERYKYPIWIFWTILILLGFFANTPDNFNLTYSSKKVLTNLFPQGWGFFTKDPREAIVDAYEINDNELKIITINNFSIENKLGLSRNNRRVGYEISHLLKSLSESKWENHHGIFKFNSPDSIYTVQSDIQFLTFRTDKEYVLHQYKPIPFAWVNTHQAANRPYSTIRFKINKNEEQH